jgi:hypothetical protein
MQKISKKIEIFFVIYVPDFIDVSLKVRKIFAFFRKKSAKGVDNPIRVCHSLASSLNVFEKIQPSLKISQPIIVGTK